MKCSCSDLVGGGGKRASDGLDDEVLGAEEGVVLLELGVVLGDDLLSGGEVLADSVHGTTPALDDGLLSLLDGVNAIVVVTEVEVDEGHKDGVDTDLTEDDEGELGIPGTVNAVISDGTELVDLGLQEGVGHQTVVLVDTEEHHW